MIRKVEIFYRAGKGQVFGVDKIKNGEGNFIQYGTDWEEFDNGAVSYSTAIVEMEDGTVRNVPVDLVRFML